MDFIIKLPTSHNYDSIWVVCNQLTQYSHCIPCQKTLTVPDLAWQFLNQIFHLHGLPDSIISDHGSVFVSKFWSELTSLLKINTHTSTAYHPQTDGLTEWMNQTLETYLHVYCSYQQDDWVDYLPFAEFAFNNLENSSTHQTPFLADYAFHPSFKPQITECSTIPVATNLAAHLNAIHTELRAELQFIQDVQTKYYNQKVLPAPKFQLGQLVWFLCHNIKATCPLLKLDHHRLSPNPIICKISSSAHLL